MFYSNPISLHLKQCFCLGRNIIRIVLVKLGHLGKKKSVQTWTQNHTRQMIKGIRAIFLREGIFNKDKPVPSDIYKLIWFNNYF